MTKKPKVRIKYKYPPADKLIVCNIARACLQHPKFYIQVCHLMNKMNMIPPFNPPPSKSIGIDSQFTDFSLEEMVITGTEPDGQKSNCDDDDDGQEEEEEEDESEIESDSNYVVTGDDDDDNYRSAVRRCLKRQSKKLKVGILGEIKKKPKKTEYDGGSSSTFNSDRDLEELESSLTKSTIPLEPVSIKINIHSNKLTSLPDLPQSPSLSSSQDINKDHGGETTIQESQGFGLMTPKVTQSLQIEIKDQDDNWINCLITDEEINTNRLSLHELINNVPVFKNYSPGLPSCRLYVKNLSKKVTNHQLKCIYGRYINLDNESHRNMFYVQVFKTGRFRNQAFISLPNQETSTLALNETNGYLIDGKPLIVSFARSTKPTQLDCN